MLKVLRFIETLTFVSHLNDLRNLSDLSNLCNWFRSPWVPQQGLQSVRLASKYCVVQMWLYQFGSVIEIMNANGDW